MRIADEFGLGLGQPSLDFINVDASTDARLFVDPRALRLELTDWGHECVSLVQSFFDHLLDVIRAGDREAGLQLLEQLREPNETHLGLSLAHSRGTSLGPGTAAEIYDSLAQSDAIKTGLIQDLEETALLVPKIAFDRISDIVTNIIRGPLIDYTQKQCDLHAIPMTAMDSGPMWDPGEHKWFSNYQDLPTAGARKLILVPKVIVRAKLHYNAEDYFNNYVLNFLVEEEISNKTELVRLLKSGEPQVSKKDVIDKYGCGKGTATRITLANPEIMDDYRAQRGKGTPDPLTHEQISEVLEGDDATEVDWDGLIAAVRAVDPGNVGASDFHKAAQALLTATLHPWLVMPVREHAIHGGAKRIDIVFTNAAKRGFFNWFGDHFPASTVVVECKNYSADLSNKEFDQLIGRFSPKRGRIGLLVCRKIDDRTTFNQRCKNAANDDQGFIHGLDDDNLAFLAERRKAEDFAAISKFFRTHHDYLVG